MKFLFKYKGIKEAFYSIQKKGTISTYFISLNNEELLQFLPTTFTIIYNSKEKRCDWNAIGNYLYIAHQVNNAIAEEILKIEDY
ncbi:hypothetical protein [Ferruginibacter sp.]|uniref:hypothetical protein n=1 Tax=Ferruginibacter sp. TaxID=1940288 RepID=UPI0019CD7011|nr:hypothetical protein [Ferruginibacter sp.]MBC7626159.1 hypothetical protein [Ferruginibacter sp.]